MLGGVVLHELDEQHPQAGVTKRSQFLAQGSRLLGIGALGGEEPAGDLPEHPVGRLVRQVGHGVGIISQGDPVSNRGHDLVQDPVVTLLVLEYQPDEIAQGLGRGGCPG